MLELVLTWNQLWRTNVILKVKHQVPSLQTTGCKEMILIYDLGQGYGAMHFNQHIL